MTKPHILDELNERQAPEEQVGILKATPVELRGEQLYGDIFDVAAWLKSDERHHLPGRTREHSLRMSAYLTSEAHRQMTSMHRERNRGYLKVIGVLGLFALGMLVLLVLPTWF